LEFSSIQVERKKNNSCHHRLNFVRSDFVLLYAAMVLDNSEHLHFRHTDYYALACSYLSMAIVNQVIEECDF